MGAATTAALYFIRLFDPFNTLLSLVDDAQEATASLARLVGVTQLPVRIPAGRPAEPTRPPPKPAATGPGCSRRRRPARWKGAPPSSWPTALTQAAAAHRAVVLDVVVRQQGAGHPRSDAVDDGKHLVVRGERRCPQRGQLEVVTVQSQ
ncbi:MAG: hypothetical protein H0U62_00510, partial [Actinobacteria bacterium]|nr:hypothetical protein [Actinomycetota bacterium]